MPSARNKTIQLVEAERAAEIPTLPKTMSGKLHSGIYCANVEVALASLPHHHFNLIIADPPYNFGRDFGNDSDKRSEADYEKWAYEWVGRIPNILTKQGSVYICTDWGHSSLYQSALEKVGLSILNRITWKREKGRGAAKNWKQNMEDIWFAVADKKEYTFNLAEVKVKKQVIAPYRENGKPKDWYVTSEGKSERLTHPSNIWTDLTVPFWSMPENTDHPTQKPEALVERIILASSNKGESILDLFSGSGTTSVVAKRLEREFIGIEMNPDYVRLGLKRLALLE